MDVMLHKTLARSKVEVASYLFSVNITKYVTFTTGKDYVETSNRTIKVVKNHTLIDFFKTNSENSGTSYQVGVLSRITYEMHK